MTVKAGFVRIGAGPRARRAAAAGGDPDELRTVAAEALREVRELRAAVDELRARVEKLEGNANEH